MTYTTEELDKIEKKYCEIDSALRAQNDDQKLGLVRKALNKAMEIYDGYEHINEKKFIFKSLDIASISVIEMGLGAATAISVLLIDAIKSGDLSLHSLAQDYGKTVHSIIEGLLKVDKIDISHLFEQKNIAEEEEEELDEFEIQERKKIQKRALRKNRIKTDKVTEQAEIYVNMLSSIAVDVRVALIKLANQLDRIRNYLYLTEEKQISLAHETSHIYTPMAHKLGLYKIKTDFEETTMKIFEPSMYSFITLKLKETKDARDEFIKAFMLPFAEDLANRGFICEVKGRAKSIYSIWKKMQKQNVAFEKVSDLFAIRVILKNKFESTKEEKEACWQVYSMVTNVYPPDPRRLRDWISNPKSSGYESLHTTVDVEADKCVEVQIRTERMDEVAETGSAAHWKYKEVKGDEKGDQWVSKLREILQAPTADRWDNTFIYSNQNYIYVFTPKGDIKRLPKGATVLDFAYLIHSRIGDQCVGAKINNKVVQIKHKLSNGDKVEIQTSKNQQPKREWLLIAASQQARLKIQQTLRQLEYKQIDLGRDLVKSAYEKFIATYPQTKLELADKTLKQLMKNFSCDKSLTFYGKVSEGEIVLDGVFEKLFLPKKRDESVEGLLNELKNLITLPTLSKSTDYLTIDSNLSKVMYTLAKCCNPLPGDSIFGFVKVAKGTAIHRDDCPNAPEMREKYPYRIVQAIWAEKTKPFLAHIRITGSDPLGILGRMVDVISKELKISIIGMRMNTIENNRFDGEFTLRLFSKIKLDLVFDRLKEINNIGDVMLIKTEVINN